MTREEARQIIATWLVSSKGAKGQRGYIEGWFDEEDVEAFRMAIEALSEEPPYQYSKAYVEQIRGERDILQDMVDNMAKPKTGWIPCSERLPKAEDMYQPPEQRYLCQLEAYGERKFCVLSRLKGAVSPFWDWYGVAVHDSEVIAWMPLPEPYKGGDSE